MASMNLPMSFGNSSKAKQGTKKAKVMMSIQLKAKPSTADAPPSAATAPPWASAGSAAEDSSDEDSDSADEEDDDRRRADSSDAQEAGASGDFASGSADEDDDAYDDDADEDPLGLPMRNNIVLKVCVRARALVPAAVLSCNTDVASWRPGSHEAVLGAGLRSSRLALLHGELRLPGEALGLQRDELQPAVIPSV